MRISRLMALLPLVALVAACGGNGAPKVDDALKNDLALASQAQPLNAQANISPTEAGLSAQPQALTSVARQPAAAAPARRTSSARRSEQCLAVVRFEQRSRNGHLLSAGAAAGACREAHPA